MGEMGMTNVGPSSNAAAGLLNRLFALVDKDKDSAVSGAELSALLDSVGQGAKSGAILAANDSDGDGALSTTEWPNRLVSDDNIGQLLSLQDLRDLRNLSAEQRKEKSDTLKQAYFTRVDTDGNGVLSGDEVEADRVLNLANTLDSGAPPNTAVMIRAGADRNALTMDDIAIAQRIDMSGPKAVELTDAQKTEFAAMRDRMAAIAKNADADADTTPDAGEPQTAEAQAEKVSTANLSHSLIMRLLAQFTSHSAMGAAADISA